MPRPCKEAHELKPAECRLCWLSVNDERYMTKWNCKEENELKVLKTKIVKFCETLIQHIKNNYKETTENQYKQRLDICSTCPNKSDNWECNLCGCSLPYKAKWAVAKCDAKKWPLLVISNKKGCVPCGKNKA